MMGFIYKGKEYTWDEWHSERNNFIKEIELPKDLLIDIPTRDWSMTYDIGYSIAISKFRELYKLIDSARNFLINSYNKFYDSNIIERGSGYKYQIWMRGEYLKNSIIWYNSCEDYIYQILWFALGMSEREIISPIDYENQLKKACYKSIMHKLEKINIAESSKLLLHINKYRLDSDVKYMREKLANNLKHRGNLNFLGLEEPEFMRYEKLDKHKNIIFSSDWIRAMTIDIDETIDILKRVHIKLIIYSRYIKDFVSIENMFEINENSSIIERKGIWKF